MPSSKELYLAKYASKSSQPQGDYVKSKKKRKKKKKGGKSGLRVIDEDYDWKADRDKDKLSFKQQISKLKTEGAAIVSMEEALSKQREDEEDMIFRNAKLKRNDGSGWVTVQEDHQSNDAPARHDSDAEPDDTQVPRKRHDSDAENSDGDGGPRPGGRHDSDADESPVRRGRHDSDHDSDDQQPTRGLGGGVKTDAREMASGNASNTDDDLSPVRRRQGGRERRGGEGRRAERRHDSGDESDDMEIESRRKRRSPGNKARRSGNSRHDMEIESRRKRRSPRRKDGRSGNSRHSDSDSDLDPRRSTRRPRQGSESDGNTSPVRRRVKKRKVDSDDDGDMDVRRRKSSRNDSESEGEDDKKPEAMGLLTSKQFTNQNLQKERAKMEVLRKMNPENSGAQAKTIFRDRRGRKLESLQKFMDQKSGNRANDEESKMEWGGGLVQKEAKEARKDDLAKLAAAPFARSRDDEEMNQHLRNRERWGDPMLSMIRRKKRKKRKKEIDRQLQEGEKGEGTPGARGTEDTSVAERDATAPETRPYYQGQPWPNRYGILPGYRWDGVDRANGWEQKRMLHLNNVQHRKKVGYKILTANSDL